MKAIILALVCVLCASTEALAQQDGTITFSSNQVLSIDNNIITKNRGNSIRWKIKNDSSSQIDVYLVDFMECTDPSQLSTCTIINDPTNPPKKRELDAPAGSENRNVNATVRGNAKAQTTYKYTIMVLYEGRWKTLDPQLEIMN